MIGSVFAVGMTGLHKLTDPFPDGPLGQPKFDRRKTGIQHVRRHVICVLKAIAIAMTFSMIQWTGRLGHKRAAYHEIVRSTLDTHRPRLAATLTSDETDIESDDDTLQ